METHACDLAVDGTPPCTIIILDGSGDLTRRKLIPALLVLFQQDRCCELDDFFTHLFYREVGYNLKSFSRLAKELQALLTRLKTPGTIHHRNHRWARCLRLPRGKRYPEKLQNSDLCHVGTLHRELALAGGFLFPDFRKTLAAQGNPDSQPV